MTDYGVMISLEGQALRLLEEKAKALRSQIKTQEAEDVGAERRLETIERVLGQLYAKGWKSHL